MKPFALVTLALALLLCVGCASHIPMAPQLADSQAKTFQPPTGMAGIYIIGYKYTTGVVFQVAVDGTLVGPLTNQTYFWFPVPPGTHTIVVSSQENSVRETLSVAPGHSAFLGIYGKMGLMTPRVGVRVLDPTTGHQAVRRSRLAQRLDQ